MQEQPKPISGIAAHGEGEWSAGPVVFGQGQADRPAVGPGRLAESLLAVDINDGADRQHDVQLQLAAGQRHGFDLVGQGHVHAEPRLAVERGPRVGQGDRLPVVSRESGRLCSFGSADGKAPVVDDRRSGQGVDFGLNGLGDTLGRVRSRHACTSFLLFRTFVFETPASVRQRGKEVACFPAPHYSPEYCGRLAAQRAAHIIPRTWISRASGTSKSLATWPREE